MRHLWLSGALGWTLALAGCSSTESSEDPATARRASRGSTDWSEALQAGDPQSLLSALGQPHAAVRDALGPHRLELHSTLSLQPSTEAPPNPPLGAKIVPSQSVTDTVELVWNTPDESGPRFALHQHNDQRRGRSVVLIGGMLYAQLQHRGWTMHPLETEVHELWLDDAQHAARDAVEFLLPGAQVEAAAAPGEGLDGADALQIELTRSDAGTPTADGAGWRKGIAFDALSAQVLLDPTTGAWLKLDAEARYHLTGADGKPVQGVLEVHGTVRRVDASDAGVAAPAGAVALPERHRYEVERKRLLDGLAAP